MYLNSLLLLICAVLSVFGDDDFNSNKINEAFLNSPELKDENATELMSNINEGKEYFLYFYTNWCPACKDFVSTYKLLCENQFFSRNKINSFRIDADRNPELAARFFLSSLPTLLHVRDKKVRTITHLRWKLTEYFDEQKWVEVNPWSSWNNPAGLFALILGKATKLGHFLTVQAESLNFPKWKWALILAFFIVIAWGPVLYLGISNSSAVKKPTVNIKRD